MESGRQWDVTAVNNLAMEVVDVRLLDYLAKTHIIKSPGNNITGGQHRVITHTHTYFAGDGMRLSSMSMPVVSSTLHASQ